MTNRHLLTILGTSIILTLFLAFIDEGYYSFEWMADPGSWIAVIIYASLFFALQYFVLLLFLKFRGSKS